MEQVPNRQNGKQGKEEGLSRSDGLLKMFFLCMP